MTLPANTVEELLRIGVVKRIWKDYEVKLNLPKQAEQKRLKTNRQHPANWSR